MKSSRFRFLLAVPIAVLLSCGSNDAKKAPVAEVTTKVAPPGKMLFMGNCAQCHALNADRTGPMLSGVLGRWGNDTTALVQFIKNSSAYIAKSEKDSYANKLYEKWYKTAMPAFTLPDEDIKQIIAYVNGGVE
jgi:mono/diheme cytochrome c family protein